MIKETIEWYKIKEKLPKHDCVCALQLWYDNIRDVGYFCKSAKVVDSKVVVCENGQPYFRNANNLILPLADIEYWAELQETKWVL